MNIINCYFCNLTAESTDNPIKCTNCSNQNQQVYTGTFTAQIYYNDYKIIIFLKYFQTSISYKNNDPIIIDDVDFSIANYLNKANTYILLS